MIEKIQKYRKAPALLMNTFVLPRQKVVPDFLGKKQRQQLQQQQRLDHESEDRRSSRLLSERKGAGQPSRTEAGKRMASPVLYRAVPVHADPGTAPSDFPVCRSAEKPVCRQFFFTTTRKS